MTYHLNDVVQLKGQPQTYGVVLDVDENEAGHPVYWVWWGTGAGWQPAEELELRPENESGEDERRHARGQ